MELTAGLAYYQFGLIVWQQVLKKRWGSEVVIVQAKGKGVSENGKVRNARDVRRKPSRPSINDFISV
jgi:hypothetical protein